MIEAAENVHAGREQRALSAIDVRQSSPVLAPVRAKTAMDCPSGEKIGEEIP